MNKPKTNIYDIDGKLIRKAGDNHQFTIEECQERIKYYLELLKALSTEDPDYAVKASTYNQYVDNLVAYCIRMKMVSKDIQPAEPQQIDGVANGVTNIPFAQTDTTITTIEEGQPTVILPNIEHMDNDQIDIVDIEPQDEGDKEEHVEVA